MKLIAFASILLSFISIESSFALPLSEDDYSTAFRHFINRYNKKYHHTEVAGKYNKFINNLDFIHRHNQLYHSEELPIDRRPTYKLAVNEYADMTHDEFKKHVGITKGALQQRHLPYLKSFNIPRDLYTIQPAKEIDWVEKGAVTSVKDQKQCGSCYAFSAVGAIEGAHFLATGELFDLSEQEIVDCSQNQGNQGCNGGLMDQVFEFVMTNGGICSYSNYTYTAVQGNTCLAKKCEPVAKITGYKDIEAGNEKQLMLALNRQPISVAIEADEPGFQFYAEGVMNAECGEQLDHGVLLVGYGTDIINGTSTDYWKIKNSWSSKWGENGYIRIERGRNLCGIADAASYPLIDKNPTPLILLESI